MPPLKTFKKVGAAVNSIDSEKSSLAPTPRIFLPEVSTEISEKFEDFTFLIYGERKIGKSTLFSKFKNPFFMFFEPGGASIAGVKKVNIPDWETALEYLNLLKKNPSYCDLVVIDTGYMAYERCFEYSLKKMGITTPQDKNWGTAWKFIDKEFRDFHMKLTNIGKSFGVTAHSELKEIQRRDGTKYEKLTIQLGGQATRFYTAIVDVIGYYQYDKNDKRVLTIRGDSYVEAGCRMGTRFINQKTKQPLIDIPMGNSEKDAYGNLLKAFNNQLSI